MRSLVPLAVWLCSLRDRLATTNIYQVREGNQTKWMTADEFIQEQKQAVNFLNQGVIYANRTERTITAIKKTGTLPLQTDAGTSE